MAPLERGTRPEPPEELDEEQAAVWRKTVDSMPPDWFTGATFPLLKQYCRLTAGLDFIDRTLRKIQKSKEPNLREWKRFTQIRRQECKVIAMLATKMRLAQQSSYDQMSVRPQKDKARREAAAAEVQRPWG
jgi:hypothetical protein